MTKLVQQAVAAISKLPPETQDELARFMLALAGGAATPLMSEEAAAIAEAEAEIGRGERVAPETMRAFWHSRPMNVVYAPRALRDHQSIAAYLEDRSPTGVKCACGDPSQYRYAEPLSRDRPSR
jgi:hypothetical protein